MWDAYWKSESIFYSWYLDTDSTPLPNDCGLFQVSRVSPRGSHIHFRCYVFNQFLHISWSSHPLVITDTQKMHITKAGNKDTVAGRLNSLTELTEIHSARAGIWTQDYMTLQPRCVCHQSHPATSTALKTGSQDSSAPTWRWRFQDGASVPRSRNEKQMARQGFTKLRGHCWIVLSVFHSGKQSWIQILRLSGLTGA